MACSMAVRSPEMAGGTKVRRPKKKPNKARPACFSEPASMAQMTSRSNSMKVFLAVVLLVSYKRQMRPLVRKPKRTRKVLR